MQRSVSVIVPCRNYGKFLEECVESVMNQSRPVHEVIIVDDASEDDSAEVAGRLMERFESVRFIGHSEWSGVAACMNEAMAVATGDYIMRLDADDKVHADYVKLTAAVLDKRPRVGIVYTDVTAFGPLAETRSRNVKWWDKKDRGGEFVWNLWYFTKPHILKARLNRTNFIHGAALFRKKLYAMGLRLPNVCKYEDWAFWKAAVNKGWLVHKVAKPLLYYRHHSGVQRNHRSIERKGGKPQWRRRDLKS